MFRNYEKMDDNVLHDIKLSGRIHLKPPLIKAINNDSGITMAKNMKAMKSKKAQRAMRGMGVAQNKMVKNQKAQELPINESPSNEKWDKLGYSMFVGLIVAAIVMVVSGMYYTATGFQEALAANPINWGSCIWMTLLLGMIYFVGRGLISIAFFGTVMLASKFGAWQCAENISRAAIIYRFLVPNGSGWAAMALVQSLISRGKFEESIKLADEEIGRAHV